MSTHFLKITVTVVSTLLLSACQTKKVRSWSPEDLIIADQASLAFAKEITPNQASEDIEFLIYALSNAYGGRKYVPDDSMAKAIATLKNVSSGSSLAEFHDRIDEALFLIPDNHLRALYKGNVSRKRRAQEKTGNVGRNNIRNPD
jgi:hypothetical protein